MHDLIVQKALFPLHEFLKGHDTLSIHQSLMQSQWFSPSKITNLQLERLHHFLKDVNKNVPFYQKNAPISLWLKDWPILTKDRIREHFESFKHPSAKGLQKKSTGGSTGQPLYFLVGKERISHDVAAKWRATRWWGVDIGDKELVIWGSPIESSMQSGIKKWRDRCLNTTFISASSLTQEKAIHILKQIQLEKPKMLFSYPSILSYLADIAMKEQLDVYHIARVAFVTSELLEPFQKDLIENVFGCFVANGYGGRDAGFIAHTCPMQSLHICSEDIILEILDDQDKPLPDGEQGEIVITHLRTRDFPFIRYKTGDIGAISKVPCACGRNLPVLTNLEGRQSDLIYTTKGAVVHRSQIFQIISSFKEITHFRFAQNTLHDVQLWITSDNFPQVCEARLDRLFKELLGEEISLNLHCVEHLPVDKSGKHRFVTSLVNKMRVEEGVA